VDVITKVFEKLDVDWNLGETYKPREYVALYRESDFDFASRLLEEDGIFYYFKHTPDGHKMIVSDSTNIHPENPEPSEVRFVEAGTPAGDDDRITGWLITQELRAGSYTLWDQNFELTGNPGTFKHLETTAFPPESVLDGQVERKIKLAVMGELEIYDYPGGYAQRFDGVSPGGSDRGGNLKNIFDDSPRTTQIRMEQEATPSLLVRGVATAGSSSRGTTLPSRSWKAASRARSASTCSRAWSTSPT
jgi:type VI secretion system secreted protein VgrG